MLVKLDHFPRFRDENSKIFELPPPSWCFIILRLVCFRIILPRPRPSTYQLATRGSLGCLKMQKKNMAFLESNFAKWLAQFGWMFWLLKKKHTLGFIFCLRFPKLVFQESTTLQLQQFIFAVVTHHKWHMRKVCFFERCCWSWKLLLQTNFYEKWTLEMDHVIRLMFNIYLQILSHKLTPCSDLKKTTSSSTWPIRPIPCSETLGVFLVRFLRRCQTLLTVCSRSFVMAFNSQMAGPMANGKNRCSSNLNLYPHLQGSSYYQPK